MSRDRFAIVLLPLLIATVALIAACSGRQFPTVRSSGAEVTEVTRQVLAAGTSDRAPGQMVNLYRVIIPRGKDIPAHTHPGPQLAFIAEGTLTYTVLKGEVQVTRAAGSPQAKVETVKAGQTVELRTGDSLAETSDLVHTAKNQGKTPVVIYLSALFPEGAPASSPAQ